MGKKETVKIDVNFQRQPILDECGRQEVEVSQELLVLVDFGADKEAAAIVEHVDHGKELWCAGKPGMRGGVKLPEFSDLAALPAFDWSLGPVVGSGVGQAVLDSPAADLSPVQRVATEPERLAGGEAVGGWRLAAKALAQEGLHLGRPYWSMVASRKSGRPGLEALVGAGIQVVGVELVKAGSGKAQAMGGGLGFELIVAEGGQHMTD